MICTFGYEKIYYDEVIAALNKGKLVVGKDLRMKHAVLIFYYRMNQEGRVVYDHYDSVAGRNYNISLGSNSYQFYIINDLK